MAEEGKRQGDFGAALRWLLGMAAVVIVVAGLRAAQPLVVPFLIAAFLAVICGPPLQWLQDKRVPTVLALLMVIAGASLIFLFVVGVVGASINDFVHNLGKYQEQLGAQQAQLVGWLHDLGLNVPEHVTAGDFNAKRLMGFFASLLSSLGGVLSNTFLVLLTLVFILLEASGFRGKLIAICGDSSPGLENATRIRQSIRHYVSIKTGISLATALAVFVWLKILGIDYPMLWSLLAFFFNFVPNIGSIIASVPPVLLALVQFGPGRALVAGMGFLVIHGLIGNVLEPRIMGKGLGLSTLVVFTSLVFWGWVLGPVGMLLSVPLTMIGKIVLEASAETRWLAILLGPDELSSTNQKGEV